MFTCEYKNIPRNSG